MAKLSHTDSRRMYSWWWDSHISPKNSKWLHENLSDMDVKVKAMIKLLEVDEDSFARRAEMYYKKRPELLKIVEEFYRAYRALAEKYDHASGLIRHAHRTMSEAFPDQVAMVFVDESPVSSVSRADSKTPDLPTPMGQFTDESGNGTRTEYPKPFYDSFGPVEQVRRGLNFDEAEDKEESAYSNGNNHINDLKSAQLDRESNSNERDNSAEIEAQPLKSELDKIAVEKDAALDQYMQSLEMISSLENKIGLAEEHLLGFKKRAESAESEVERLRQVISKLTEEKETAALQYQQCLETISSLEQKLILAKEEAKRINGEIENGVSKLQKAEEQYLMLERSNLSLHSELESLMLKMGTHSQELAEKQKELEQSCQSLMEDKSTILDEKAALMTQLQETNTNLRKVSKDNKVLLNSLSDAHHQLEALKAKSNFLEDSCQLHVNEKADLISEKDILTSLLEKTQTRLLYFEKLHGELEGRCEHLENEKEPTLHKVEELQMSLAVERQRRDTELGHVLDNAITSEIEFKVVATAKDQLSIEIKKAKEVLHQMAQELHEAEDKISLAEKKELELLKSVEDLRTECNDVKMVRDHQENQILKLSACNACLSKESNKRKVQEENLHLELENKTNEMNDLEIRASSLFGKLQHSMISQVLYEQKFYELHDACLGYIDQNEGLGAQLTAFGPEIVSLKECISTLEDQTAIHIKFQNPESEEVQSSEDSNNPPERILNEEKEVLKPVSDLHDLRVRLEAVVKAPVAIKELMVHANTNLQSKLNDSTRQIELLKSESGKNRRNMRPTSSNTEENDALLTKDIILDQISDGSYRYSKKEPADMDTQIVELWETADPDGNSNKIFYPTYSLNHSGSTSKQKGEDLSVDKLEISKRFTASSQEGNKKKVLQRLDSDIQKIANLQITVRDLKMKLEVTEKDARGRAVIECEQLKRLLEEADTSVTKLFHLNGRLTNSIDKRSFSDTTSSFDFEGEDGAKRRRIFEQARRMSEKIGRLQLEVQNLQFVLLKLEDEKQGRSQTSETKRRVVLRDYLYGGGRTTGQRRRKSQFFACVQPSTIED